MNKALNGLALLLSFLFFAQNIQAQGDLMIMPKRVVFEGNERSREVNLINTGTDTATYAISFIQYKMSEEGDFEQIQEPLEGQKFADDFLRYYPRRVSLPPKEAQTVRLQLTRTGDMSDGEYRSHLYFRAIEDQKALSSTENNDQASNISINIKTVFGISIPVIIRRGDLSADISIQNVKLSEDNTLNLEFVRNGEFSSYGNLIIKYRDAEAKVHDLGKVKGIAVYTPNKKRKFSLKLQNTEGLDLSSGELLINYEDDSGRIYASTQKSL